MEERKLNDIQDAHIREKWKKHPDYIILPTKETFANDKKRFIYNEWYNRINRAEQCKNIKLLKRICRESNEVEPI
tara:strand:- start:3190 stop:3414 length:225 start_codon:yes stop_codon:yes gene_type:complete